jgi:muramidase (phage lysozyme)
MYESYLSNPNVRAFLDVLAYCEGANYNTMFGGGSFGGNQHPCSKVRAGGYNSDAAGRYQFLCSTWRGLGLPDFSPYWQDVGAVMLIARRGALEDVANGDLQRAIPKLRQEWPSLPGGHQQTRNWDQVVSYFQNDLAAQGASNYVPTSGNVILDDGYSSFSPLPFAEPSGIDVGTVLGAALGVLLLAYLLDL